MPRISSGALSSPRRPAATVALAAVIVAATVATGVPSVPGAAQLAGMALVAALWLMPLTGGGEGRALVVLTAAAAFHSRALSLVFWNRESSGFAGLWPALAGLCAVALVLGTAFSISRELRGIIVALLLGIPTLPAGNLWAAFPVVCLLLFGARGTKSRWWWLTVAWAFGEVARAPCRLDAALTLAMFGLGYAGFRYGQTLSRTSGWILALGAALTAPFAAGSVWTLAAQGSRPPLAGWGVNPNPLAAQTALGLLLVFVGLRGRHRILSWGLLLAGSAGVLLLGSIWPLLCLAATAAVAVLPPGPWRRRAIWGIGVVPLLALVVVVLPAPELPPRLQVSYLARQYHWHAAVRHVLHHPFGSGLANVHPQALGAVVAPAGIMAIPGSQMQHAHHGLLHLAEQGGLPLLLLALLLSARWIVRFAGTAEWTPAGIGVLFLWMNNGADLSITYEPLVFVCGLLVGLSRPAVPSGSPWRSGVLLLPYGAVWLTSLAVLAGTERISRGDAATGSPTAMAVAGLHAIWGSGVEAGPTGLLPTLAPHGRCAQAVPSLVDRAAESLAAWKPAHAESSLREAVRRDPAGVIPSGGGRARVLLGILLRQTGRGEASRAMMSGVRWAEAEATMALGTLEYHSLRRQEARVDSVLKHVFRTSRDPFLVARFAEERGKRTALRVPGRGGGLPQDVLKDEVERLLVNGLIEAARNKVSSPAVEVEPWLLTMLGSKIAVAEGDMVRAVALASRAVAQSGGSDASRWELVKVLSQSSHTQEALREAGKLVERRPADPAVRLLRAQTLLDAGLPHDALTDLDQAESLGGEAVACGIARSQALRLIGDGAGAERVLVGLLAAHPGTSWPAYELASWAEEEGRIADAIKWSRQAVSRAPADHGSRVLLGRVLIRAGMVVEGRQHLGLVTKDPRAGPGWQTDARREMERLKGGAG